MALKFAHELRLADDDAPTLRLDEPLTHARRLLRALDEAEKRPTVPPRPKKKRR